MTEREAIGNLKHLTARLETLNARLENEAAKMRQAIILLTDVVDEILPFVTADQEIIARAKAANEAARRTIAQDIPYG